MVLENVLLGGSFSIDSTECISMAIYLPAPKIIPDLSTNRVCMN